MDSQESESRVHMSHSRQDRHRNNDVVFPIPIVTLVDKMNFRVICWSGRTVNELIVKLSVCEPDDDDPVVIVRNCF